MNFELINFTAIVTILRFRFIAFIFLLFFTAPLLGQVKFTTITSSKEIGRGDYVQVEFVVENAKQIEHLTPPAFPDFHIVEGPMQSSGMSIVNGNMSQYKAVSFILQPVKTGKFTVQGATAEIDGKQMRSNAVSIDVSTNGSGNPNSINPMLQPSLPSREQLNDDKEYVLRPGENIAEKTKKNLFVKVQVDKNSCYVGEPIVATYKLYSRLRSESKVTKNPSLNGFSVYDMIDPNTDQSSVETINGKTFTVHIIRKTQLIPLQAGPVELSQVEVENTVHYFKETGKHPRASNSILQNLLDQLSEGETGDDVQQQITLTSKPLTITVKPLPETNKPADYNGAVGDFSMDAKVENKNISVQDAATLKVTIHGSGNLPVVDAPQVQWPSNINVYSTTSKEDIDKTVAPMKGSKTFEYVFTPKVAGSYNIPAIQFSYFDPASSSYKTLQSQPLQFNAAIAKKQSPSLSLKNILSSQTGNGIINDVKDFFVQHLEWLFAAVILFIVAFFLWRHNIRSLKKEDGQRQEALSAEEAKKEIVMPAAEVADPLLRAKRMLENADHRGFYTELNRALWDALDAKFNLPSSDLNKYNISIQLKAKGWDEENIFKLQDILNKCEMNLYTPDHSGMDMENILLSAEQVIKYINQV